MTIKQQGGIFGRNPTFNDVEVEGTLTTTGSLSVPADSISGDAINGGTPTTAGLTVDTTTLVVDAANNRVGVGTAAPSALLHAMLPSGQNGDIISLGRSADAYQFKLGQTTNSMFYIGDNSSSILVGVPYTGGITFNGDTAAANALDDYEEGTWTPVFNGVTGGSQRGTYTKVGDLVTAYGYMDGGTATVVQASVTGLPFAAGSEKGAVHSWHNTWTPTSDGGWVYQSGTNLQFITDNSTSAENAASGTKFCMFVAIYKT